MSKTSAVFKSSLLSCTFIFKSGKVASFINGRYITSDEQEIIEITKEIKSGHPHIYVDQDELSTEVNEPIDALRAKFFEEFKLAQQQNLALDNDRGSYESKVVPSNTVDIGANTSNSTSKAVPVIAVAKK